MNTEMKDAAKYHKNTVSRIAFCFIQNARMHMRNNTAGQRGAGFRHGYGDALLQAPHPTTEYACGTLGRLATNPHE